MSEIDQQDNIALRVSKKLNASVAEVWNAWTNPEEIAKWWLPEGFSESGAPEVDLRVGGEFKYHMQPPDGDAFYAHGIFKEIVPNSKIKSTWLWSTSDEETELTIEFNETGDSTELVILHEFFTDEEEKNKHTEGWLGMIDRIEKLF